MNNQIKTAINLMIGEVSLTKVDQVKVGPVKADRVKAETPV